MSLKTINIENTPLEMLLEDYYFEYNWKTLKIPAHFVSDNASIPRVFSFLYRKEDKSKYWIHDYFYSKAFEKHGNKSISRKDADLKLLFDIKTWERYPIYYWVRLLGWISWKKDYNYKKYKKAIKFYKKTLTSKIEIWNKQFKK